MKVNLYVRQMWDVVNGGDIDDHKDRRDLDVLLAMVSLEMASILAKKPSAKFAWDSIASSDNGNDRVRRSTLHELQQEWDRLVFRSSKDIDDFALHLSALVRKLELYGDDDISEERAVEKLLRVVPNKYTEVALAVEMLMDLSELTIEEVTGRLKAIDNRCPSSVDLVTARFCSLGSSGVLARGSRRRGRRPGRRETVRVGLARRTRLLNVLEAATTVMMVSAR